MTMNMRKAVLPMMGVGMAAAAVGMAVHKRHKKTPTLQSAAGKAIKAVGEVVENFSNVMKN